MATLTKKLNTRVLKRQLNLCKTIKDTVIRLEKDHCCSYDDFLYRDDFSAKDIELLKVIADAAQEIECTNYFIKNDYKVNYSVYSNAYNWGF